MSAPTDPRMYDVILSPVITEKATIASEHNQVIFKVARYRDQAADQGSGREAVRREGQGRQHAGAQGQVQGVPRPTRRAVGREESDRDPARGSPHRRDHRTVRRSKIMALKRYNPTTPSQRQLVLVDRSALYKGKPVKDADRRQELDRRPQQQRPHHGAFPRRRPQADATASSTSSAASSTCRRRSSGSNTIRTAPRSSRW